MKPTKNRVFCIGVKRSKMIFESREKADNFIKFNSVEILEENGKAPVRSYYCVFCGGWHVTSSMSTIASEHLDDRDNGIISMVMDSKEKEKNTKEISSQLALIRRNIVAGKIWLAEERLENCKRIFQDMKVSKRETIKETIGDLSHKIELLKQFLDMDSKAQNAALASEEYADIKTSAILFRDFSKVEDMIADTHTSIECQNKENACKKTAKCLNFLKSRRSIYKKSTYNRLEQKLLDLRKQAFQLPSSKLWRLQSYASKVQKRIKKEQFKTSVLDIINKLEQVKLLYDEGDYRACEDTLDVCNTMLVLLDVNNADTQLLKTQLDKWTAFLQVQEDNN